MFVKHIKKQDAYDTAKVEVEHLIRKHKLLRISDIELEAFIDALMFERDCRCYADEAEVSMNEAFEQFTTQQYKEFKSRVEQ
jgi:uncharacterized protein YjcR